MEIKKIDSNTLEITTPTITNMTRHEVVARIASIQAEKEHVEGELAKFEQLLAILDE
jgi:hypothetical protein